ncbi:MAG: D-glycero-beta-D-manno-heptose 1-phosphate adenylyltransferase [Calditrichae bacterium]|nr:D-glycero-beta-D-manno-heptose 1-phosphate adenylyltransferase [Calditrichia bacterium]
MEKQNKQLVFTNGCFDILHRGHVEYLRQAKVLGDLLFVGLNSDNSVTRLKGRGRPILAQEDRAFILASLAVVDYVSIFDEETPQELIQAIQPDILVKGGDYRLNQIVGRRVVEERGGQVKTIPLIPNRSTSDILQKIISFTKQGFFNKV